MPNFNSHLLSVHSVPHIVLAWGFHSASLMASMVLQRGRYHAFAVTTTWVADLVAAGPGFCQWQESERGISSRDGALPWYPRMGGCGRGHQPGSRRWVWTQLLETTSWARRWPSWKPQELTSGGSVRQESSEDEGPLQVSSGGWQWPATAGTSVGPWEDWKCCAQDLQVAGALPARLQHCEKFPSTPKEVRCTDRSRSWLSFMEEIFFLIYLS